MEEKTELKKEDGKLKTEDSELRTKKIVPDTSVLIHGNLSRLIESGELKDAVIIIPKVVVDELQSQASTGREVGFEGLEEIKKIREMGEKHNVKVEFLGKRPSLEEIQLARKGRLDALIRDVAVKSNATLLTCDYVQALVGQAEGINVKHIPQPDIAKEFLLEKFFTKETQSVHLKVNVCPLAKRGPPGNVDLIVLRKELVTEDELNIIINQIFSKVRLEEESFTEIGRKGATVIQLGNYRISITRPPFSDGLELTAVRPIAKVKLDYYKLSAEVLNRILGKSSGVLIAGPPGSGKSTFAAALAEFISSKGKIVKTFEQPRDLQVGPEITQYGPLEGDWEKTAEILLLVRPDYTIFDEVRKTKDFHVFSDMRLAGVGMVGVVHASDPVDAIQRFIGRIELGVIPHVIDTIIFVEAGRIEKIYELGLVVKMPSGMKEADLTRPVVEVKDFETKQLEYEIYTYGEENIIIPVRAARPMAEKTRERVLREMRKWDPEAEIEPESAERVTVRVANEVIARLIGKQGKNINEMENMLGVRINVEPREQGETMHEPTYKELAGRQKLEHMGAKAKLKSSGLVTEEREQTLKNEVEWNFMESGAYLNIIVEPSLTGEQVDIYSGEEFIFSPYVGKKGSIRIKKKSELGRKLLTAMAAKRLRVMV